MKPYIMKIWLELDMHIKKVLQVISRSTLYFGQNSSFDLDHTESRVHVQYRVG